MVPDVLKVGVLGGVPETEQSVEVYDTRHVQFVAVTDLEQAKRTSANPLAELELIHYRGAELLATPGSSTSNY